MQNDEDNLHKSTKQCPVLEHSRPRIPVTLDPIKLAKNIINFVVYSFFLSKTAH